MMREKTMNENDKVAGLPELAKSVIWMINFGYLGIQIALDHFLIKLGHLSLGEEDYHIY